jgi:putative PIN family toxin of toxin-antitoxin system
VKIFLDTNVLVSAYATRGICVDLMRHILREHTLLTGEVNLIELRQVLTDKFRAPTTTVRALEAELRVHTIVPTPAVLFDVMVRDPDDLLVLSAAHRGGADLLVTGDEDLLCVAAQAPLPVVSPRGCWERLRR